MVQDYTGPFVNGSKGELPLDLLMRQLFHNPRISMHLLPLPASSTKASSSHSADDVPRRQALGPRRPDNPKKKAKPSGKAKANRPEELKGYHQFDDIGNLI